MIVSKSISMQLTQVSASQEQIAQLMKYPKDTPIVMTNIIKFNAITKNGDETGQASLFTVL